MAEHLFVGPDGGVIAIREYAPSPRVFVALDREQAAHWERILRNDRTPLPVHPGYAISEEGLQALVSDIEAIFPDGTDPESDIPPTHYMLGNIGQRFIACARSFREFLKVWHFLDQDTGVDRLLGDCLWAGQETYVREAMLHLWLYSLKNRQIGYTTIACAYDAWVLRFRTQNARVHLVSRTETLAKNSLLKPLKYGVKRLPPEMLLPIREDTTTTFQIGTDDDRRHAQAYPAKEPGRAETCSHLHLDEWAAMAETYPELPREVWAAAEPTISKQGGSVHILCTGTGPEGYYADVWNACVDGEGQLHASFIPATGARPEYTPEFLADKKRRMADDTKFMHEYPETWEDALSGGQGLRFPSHLIDAASEDAGFPEERGSFYIDARGKTRHHRYVKAWDIAGPSERSDAIVGVVIKLTDPHGVWDIVHVEYHHSEDYPVTAERIRIVHRLFPGPTVIEDNEAGKAVRAFLDLPDTEVFGWTTTRTSKPTMISSMSHALQEQTLKWDGKKWPILDNEFRRYQLPDDNIKQDCVMAVGVGVAWVLANPALATQTSRVMTEHM